MVQREVSSNKLGIQANNTLKMEKRQAITKSFSQNYDGKNKGAHLKAIKMKKSRSIKRGDLEFSLHSSSMKKYEVGEQPGEPPTLVTPTKTLKGQALCAKRSPAYAGVREGWSHSTVSPKNTSPCNNKSPYGSPNYMKSTTSSKARKENTTKVNISPSTTKLHRARETLGKTSSLKRFRTLTKVPSFKHTRAGANKNVVLCEDDIDLQRATCSSTLKDSKFPPFLKLKPGATEAQGTSVMKVCPYTYCSLNGHHHNPAPPLKYFLSSRRKLLKTQKIFNPEVNFPSNRKPSEIKVKDHGFEMDVIFSGVSEMPESPKLDFFVEIYVPDKEGSVADVQISENLSETARSEIDFLDGAALSEDAPNLSVSIFSSQGSLDVDSPIEIVESFNVGSDGEADTVSAVSLDQFFGEVSDMEWEEAQIPATHEEKSDVPVESDGRKDDDDPSFEDLEFLAWKLSPYMHDEIMECLQFSDVDSSSDGELTQTDEEQVEEQVSDDETICSVKLEEEPFEEQHNYFSDPTEDVNGPQSESLDSLKEQGDTNGDYSNDDNYISDEITEGNNADVVMEGESSDCTINDVPAQTGQAELAHDSDEVNPRSDQNDTGEAELSDIEDINESEEEAPPINTENQSQEIQKFIPQKQNDSGDDFQEFCDKLKRTLRYQKADEESEEDREFNPRPPNFLPVQPDPDAEKVDLRHQEMDERRNSEEWMTDYALQKTVNHLGLARKTKVSMLVQAFEAVLPASKYEPHMRRRSSSAFAHAPAIQACS